MKEPNGTVRGLRVKIQVETPQNVTKQTFLVISGPPSTFGSKRAIRKAFLESGLLSFTLRSGLFSKRFLKRPSILL